MAKRKRRIGKNQSQKAKPNVRRGTDPNQSDFPLTFDLSNANWLKCVNLSKDRFTNRLKDEEMFVNYITELFHKIFPIIQQNGNEMIKEAGTKGWRHCHPVAESKIDLALEIMEEVHGSNFNNGKIAGPKLWQFGVSQGIRLIAIHDYTNNSLIPLFIDYHHLIEPDTHFNTPDYFKAYKYCPLDDYYGVKK